MINLFSNINLYYKLTKFASDLTEVEIPQFKRWFNLKKNVTDRDIKNWFNNNQSLLLAQTELWSLESVYLDSTIIAFTPPDSNKFYINTKSRKKFDDFIKSRENRLKVKYKISKETFIPGYKNIPDFYYIEIAETKKPVELNNKTIISPEIAHNNFIVDGLRNLLGLSDDEIVEFYKNNKEKINKIKHSQYMEGAGAQLIGAGKDGPAFKMGRGIVIKFYTSKSLYDSSRRDLEVVESDKQLIETELRLYDVGLLGIARGSEEVYYNIMEYAKPVRDERVPSNRDPLNKLLDDIKNSFNVVFQSSDSSTKELKSYLMTHKKRNDTSLNELLERKIQEILYIVNTIMPLNPYLHDISNYAETHKLQPDWLKKLCAEVSFKLLTGRLDLHAGNFGVTNSGYVRCFDPFYNMFS